MILASLVLGLRDSHRTSRWRYRVPLAFPVLARGGGRWGRARSAGHQASRASSAPNASTYLYPRAITEANELGGDSGRAIVIPNGIVTSEFDASYAARLAAIEEIKKEGADKHLWKLVYIARVVPIKGLLDMTMARPASPPSSLASVMARG